ncbi:transposase [Streptomyces sp. 3214.6]|uniref:transposase n=1 Tax=Streptomyces sp. 3214.6 TaxID=1882757 RepID=UPI001E5B0DD0|nr:transposase [Streptomyces sp. 3214.6]
MKLVVQVKLLPTPEQASVLEATLHACNRAADHVSRTAFELHQLGEHLRYKARQAGVPFMEVDPRHTSQRCPRCGHTEKANRSTREHFCCRRCGLAGPADHVAGVNVRNRARSAWVLVTAPAPSP